MKRVFGLLAFLLVSAPPARAQNFEFSVRHIHLLRDCRGVLKITKDGIEYQTQHAADGRKWRFEDIRALELKSSTEVSLITYEDQRRYGGKDRIFEYTLLKDRVTPDLSSFLLARVKRPMMIAVLPESGIPEFEFRVKHLHTIAGSMGVLRIYDDHVVFQSDREGDSRYWRIADIERFSQPDRFRFQVVSYLSKAGGPTEIYNFQLLADLPEDVHDYLWTRLHPSSYYPAVSRGGLPAKR